MRIRPATLALAALPAATPALSVAQPADAVRVPVPTLPALPVPAKICPV